MLAQIFYIGRVIFQTIDLIKRYFVKLSVKVFMLIQNWSHSCFSAVPDFSSSDLRAFRNRSKVIVFWLFKYSSVLT